MKAQESISTKLAETIALLESGSYEPCTASELYGFMNALLWVLAPEEEQQHEPLEVGK